MKCISDMRYVICDMEFSKVSDTVIFHRNENGALTFENFSQSSVFIHNAGYAPEKKNPTHTLTDTRTHTHTLSLPHTHMG